MGSEFHPQAGPLFIQCGGTPEQHEQFAAALTLLLPNPTYHTTRKTENITPGVIESARRGAYFSTFGPRGNSPYAFDAPEYWLHLRPIIREIWRVVYLAK